MGSDAADARLLLRVGPDGYIAERTRLVKQARAAGDRALANAYQSFKHPSRSLWAVLAGGDDVDAVHGIVNATSELATIQAGGSDAKATAAATQVRRKALEAVVDRAVKALAQWDSGAAARRAEIRSIIDQLSRHPDVAEAWTDGTLRDLPDDTWGFGAFEDMEPAAAASPRTTDRAARAARAEHTRQARQDEADAGRDLAAAERRLQAARKALRVAEAEMRLAESEHSAAEQRHKQALARIEPNE
jgi:hypothetical protein